MINFRKCLFVIATFVTVGHLLLIDYTNLYSSKNLGNYLGVSSMIFIAVAMALSIRNESSRGYDKPKS